MVVAVAARAVEPAVTGEATGVVVLRGSNYFAFFLLVWDKKKKRKKKT